MLMKSGWGKHMKSIAFVFLPLALFSCATGHYVRAGFPPLRSVEQVDLSRYLGRWYEIARFPFVFEDGLINTTATYGLQQDGTIEVLNEGYRDSAAGKKETARGRAWIPDPKQTARLKVSFFGPFSSDYWVIMLDEKDYSYAVVSTGYQYLWILNRTPVMDAALYERLVRQAAELGFDTGRLIKVHQEE
jgi:apolipoprotein D and lipocalin family protein